METVFIIAFVLLIVFIDFIPICKDRRPKVIWIYSIVMAVSLTVIFLRSYEVEIPSPSYVIMDILQAIFSIK